jgi:hypothetical protein
MKSDDIFTSDMDDDLDELDFDTGMDFSDEQHPINTVYSPVHASIDPKSYVALVQNASIIQSGTWEEVSNWIEDNWKDLSGQYHIAQDGAVLHTFTLAS